MASEAVQTLKYAPRRIQFALIVALLPICGGMAHKLWTLRGDELGETKQRVKALETEVGNLRGEVEATKIRVAGQQGTLERLETKSNRMEDKLDRILEWTRGR